MLYITSSHSYVTTPGQIIKKSGSSRGIYYAGLGGLFLGLSVFAQPTSLVLIPGLCSIFYFLNETPQKNTCSFLIALVITLFFIGLVNY